MEHSENSCPVCSEHIEIYAVGACDHPICFKCSTRMRVLCEQMYCPICRTDLPKVYLVNKIGKFETINSRGWHSYRRCNTYFEDKVIKSKFFELLDHKCPICKDRPPDRYMQDLSRHMRREHQRFYCDLCVEHLKIFQLERKHYDRSGLATHRREGDPDDSSYKGHPLCRFCDERYLDNDELSRHLRKDHYYCHFCDTDGTNQFYSEYPVLMEHFREEHYLCEEGECASAQFTHAFRSDIDFKAHKANCHSKGMKRSLTKQARTLDVEFALAPRNRPERSYRDYERSGRGGRGPRNGRDRYNNNHRQDQDDPELAQAMEASLNEARDQQKRENRERKEVPNRGQRERTDLPNRGQGERKELPNRPQRPGETSTEDSAAVVEDFKHDAGSFPSLSGKSSPVSEVQQATDRSDTPPLTSSSLSQKLALSEHHTVRTTARSEEDFPALGKVNSGNPAQWVRGGAGVTNRDRDFPVLSNPVRPRKPDLKTAPSPQVVHVQSSGAAVVPKPVHSSKNKKAASEKNWEDFPGLPAAAKPMKVKKPATPGSWATKPVNKEKTPVIRNKKEIAETDSFSFTLADLGKSLHDDSKPAVNGSAKNTDPSSLNGNADNKSNKEKLNGSEKKSKNKKKKKEKLEGSTEEFGGYPIIEKLETEEDLPAGRHSPVVNENELNKENDVKDLKPNLSRSFMRSADKPWLMEQSGKTPWTMVDSLEDFPNLSDTNKVLTSPPKPPPGFAAAMNSNPPPGFSSNIPPARPPPGLVKPVLSQSNDIQPTDVINVQHVYSKPQNFAERNKNLIGEIRFFLSNDVDNFASFKCWSGEFRQGSLTAKKYYNQCLELFGKEKFSKIFPELLVLLPDINKQQELLSVNTSGSKPAKKGGWNTSSNTFFTCPVCRQVLITTDQNEHLSLHNLESDFPTLSRSGTRPAPGLSAWVKAT